jgi:D-tagatose-1,6-bisphosphate aldolase subunit GatZ/KbaZ
MSHPLDEILRLQKQGEPVGIPSICSAHPWVLKTALSGESPVLIEATCNQVNQFGGYTGMTPADFVRFVHAIAAENGFPPERILLGGDHLGPSPWQEQPAGQAMQHAGDMVRAYVQASYTKLHLDTSMRLGDDDPSRPLDLALAASRTALLAAVAEESAIPGKPLRYVLGTEVPIPGGATAHADQVHVTTVGELQQTLDALQTAFKQAGLQAAWEKVIAVVVQPGVEFGDDFILEYDPEKAGGLKAFAEGMPFMYEAHSTDYQGRESLRNLIRDHFAILKVGPALTFAFRQAVFALASMEAELFPLQDRSQIVQVLEDAMQRNPLHWQKHYHGDEKQVAFARKYSLSDRLRYYWSEADVQTALAVLLRNLDAAALPQSLIRQYLPDIYPGIRAGQVPGTSVGIIHYRLEGLLEEYSFACGSQ